MLAGSGRLDIRPDQAALQLHRIAATDPVVSYVQQTAEDEQRLDRVKRAATVAEAKPTFRLDVDDARIRDGTFTLIDQAATPPYKLGLTHSDVAVRGFSNQQTERRGTATLRGRFMETGRAAIDATFASGTERPDFDMAVSLEEAQLTELNDMLRARAGFDAAGGRFSFYTQLTVRDGRVEGYVKPFFEGLDVYDLAQDSGQPIPKQAYEALVGVAGSMLENRFQDQIATRADLSGAVEHPDAPTWQIVVGLVKNAFWRALMPGLDRARKPR